MILTFRPIKNRPANWQPATAHRPAPFSAPYRRTLDLLDLELEKLGATDVFLQVDATADDLRLDGQLRANAAVNHPGVILTIETRQHGTLIYETDAFRYWQENLRAIALGLEALRKVERYGIATRGQQYAGYRELGSGQPLGPGDPTPMTIDEAAAFIASHAGWPIDVDPQEVIDDLAAGYRAAAKTLHPDVGGDPELFKQLGQARDLLAGEDQ